MSRIVIWSPNYEPELIGIAPIVTQAAAWLAARGHHVDVITAFPNYPERIIRAGYRNAFYRSSLEKGVHVHRSWLRVRPQESFVDKVLYECTLALMSYPLVLRRMSRADVIVCVIPSLTAAAIAAALPGRDKLVLWVQDIVSAAAATVNGARGLTLARRMEAFAARRAERIVVCSAGFADELQRLGADPARITTVLNWVDVDEIAARPPTPKATLRFLYAGNLGYTQGFETLVAAAERADVLLDIVGDGNAERAVRAMASKRVTVRPSVPRDEYPSLLASADVHVVVQRRIAAGANLPSKIASYLASGRPVLASIAPETPAARLLKSSGGAIIVEPDDPEALAEAMRRLTADVALRRTLGSNGREFAERELARERVLPRLEKVFIG